MPLFASLRLANGRTIPEQPRKINPAIKLAIDPGYRAAATDSNPIDSRPPIRKYNDMMQ